MSRIQNILQFPFAAASSCCFCRFFPSLVPGPAALLCFTATLLLRRRRLFRFIHHNATAGRIFVSHYQIRIVSDNSVQVQWVLDNVKSATKLSPSTSVLHVTYLIALWSVSRNTKNFHVLSRYLQRSKQLLFWNQR